MGSFDDLIPGGSSQGGSGAFDDLIPKKSSLASRVLGDTGVSALKGAVGLTEVPVGIADILTGGNAGKALEGIGYRPKEAKAALDEYFSPEQKAANQYVQEGDGFLDTVKRGLSRPSVIAQSVVESLPLLLPGAAAARGISAATKVAPYIAGAAGEGLVGAGSAAEQLRQGSEDGTLSGKQTIGALASGVGTAGFGALGGKVASSAIGKKLGISDIDTVLAGGASNPANVGLAKRALSGAVSEGVLEELPQSMWEQAAQNYATDKPLGEGVGQAGAMGLLAGTAMGGTFNAMQRGEQRKAVDDANPAVEETPAAAPLGLTYNANVRNGEDPLYTFPDGSTMSRAEYEQDRANKEQGRLDSMIQPADPEPKLPENGPMAAALNVGIDSGATSLRPQGSFSDMSEFANLLGQEQQDVQSRRTGIAHRQALQREVALQDADQRVADQMAKEATQRRRAVLDQVLSDPTTQNPAERFSAELKRQGFRDSTPNADELATVQRFNDIKAAEPAGPEIEPSLPNELDAEQLGIRSRKGSSGAQSSGRDKVAEVRQLVVDGWKISNKTLVSPTGKKRILNTAEHAAAKEATRERNLARISAYRQINQAKGNGNDKSKVGERGEGERVVSGSDNGSRSTDSVSDQADSGLGKARSGEIGSVDGSQKEEIAPSPQAAQANDAQVESQPSTAPQAEWVAQPEPAEATPAIAQSDVEDYGKRVVRRKKGNEARDDLVGAIMRVTGGNGVAANMSQTITGDTANRASKVRGLFTNNGTMDLDDIANDLRTEEGYDVKDGNHLAELIREQAAGNPVYSMERNERDAAANEQKKQKDAVLKQANELGLKGVGGKRTLAVVEAEIAKEEARLNQLEKEAERKAIQAADAIDSAIGADMTEADFMRWLSDDIANTYTQEEIKRAEQDQADRADAKAQASAIADAEERAQSNSRQGNGNKQAAPQGGRAEEGARSTEGITPEQKIRSAFDSGTSSIGVAKPITVEHNGIKRQFMARQDALARGKNIASLHLVAIHQGRMVSGDEKSWIAQGYKLNGKNILSEEGLPKKITDEEARKFNANFDTNGFNLTKQTNQQAAEKFAQQNAPESDQVSKEQADRERDAVPFSMQQESQPKPQGRQTGLFTADGRVSSEAKPETKEELAKSVQAQSEAIEPVQPAVQIDTITASDKARAIGQENRIADFGEKIGGARKDKSQPLGPRNSTKEADERPAWIRKYHVMQVMESRFVNAADVGKWQIMQDTGVRGSVSPVSSKKFATEQEANDALPFVVVSKRHRVYSYKDRAGNPLFGIFRNITERKRGLVKGGFASHDEAMKYLAAHPVEVIDHKFDYPERPWLDKIERIGTNRISGDVTTKMFQDTFGFRAGEFGNWNMGGDGQAALNHAYESLLDLADAIGVPPKAISLDGQLAIAFGARGTGGKRSAAAHYEPGSVVINLTKINGAGSLAHEWWHAVDHYFAKNGGRKDSDSVVSGGFSYKSESRPELIEAIKAVVDSMMYSESSQTTDAEIIKNRAKKRMDEAVNTIDYHNRDLRGWLTNGEYNRGKKTATKEQLAQWDAMVDRLKNGDMGDKVYIENPSKMRGAMGFETGSVLRDMNAIYKSVTGRGFLKQDQQSTGRKLHWVVESIADNKSKLSVKEDETKTVKGRSSYYIESRHIDSEHTNDYWSSPEEMGARAFESYIYDKLVSQGGRSDYLVYGVENRYYSAMDMYPYPEGSERENIDKAFDALFSTIQTKETDKGVAMFSRDDVNASRGQGSGMAFRDLQAVVDRVSKGFNNLPKIHVLDSPRDLSDRRDNERTLKEQIEQAGAMDDVEGAHHNGEIYLFASGIASEERAEHVLATHEITHYGLRGTMGKGLDSALQNIWLYNKEVRAKAAVLRMQLGLTSNVSAVEEVLAEMKDSDLVKLKGWRKMVQAFRDWAHKAGFDRIAEKLDGLITKGMSDQEKADLFVANMVNAARDWVRNGKPARGYDPGTSMLGDANFSAKNDTINVDGVDRPTTNSNGKPIGQTDEALRNFWRWFGDSKVVDADGRPRVVYHGTTANIEAFDLSRSGEFGERFADAAFFTSNPEIAAGYAQRLDSEHNRLMSIEDELRSAYGKAVLKQFAETKTTSGKLTEEIKRQYDAAVVARQSRRKALFTNKLPTSGANIVPVYLRANNPVETDALGGFFFKTHKQAFAKAEQESADSVIVSNVIDRSNEFADGTGDVFAVFSPSQIKSAIGNNGNFDASNPDIRFSRNKSASVDASITEIFDGLAGRGLKKVRAEERLAEHPQAESIRYVQDNILDILEELEGAGTIKINC